MSIVEPRALLLTGPYGAGKSTLVAEIAGLLEGRVPFAAIDLDWLAWYDDGVTPGHSPAAFDMLARNLGAVVANYREAAVGHFLLAGANPGCSEPPAAHPGDGDADARGADQRARRGDRAPSEADPTSGRADDLREARRWMASGELLPFEDDVVINMGPIRKVAELILARWLAMPSSDA